MKATLRVALHGFSDFEHRALGSLFRLAAPPALALEQVREPSDADFIVADADQARRRHPARALQREADTVFIGARCPDGAAACLRRPIDALQVLREIELLASRRSAAAPAPGPLAKPPSHATARPSALLVDDSPIASRYLQLRLQALGVDTHLCPGSARALELLAQRAYGFVFIDVELGEDSALDGLALCQHIRCAHRHVEGRSLVLVLVSAQHGELGRARGSFAGCDHYLAKPADEQVLRRLLSQYRPRRPRHAPHDPEV